MTEDRLQGHCHLRNVPKPLLFPHTKLQIPSEIWPSHNSNLAIIEPPSPTHGLARDDHCPGQSQATGCLALWAIFLGSPKWPFGAVTIVKSCSLDFLNWFLAFERFWERRKEWNRSIIFKSTIISLTNDRFQLLLFVTYKSLRTLRRSECTKCNLKDGQIHLQFVKINLNRFNT